MTPSHLALDPGTHKFGFVLVHGEKIVKRGIEPRDHLPQLVKNLLNECENLTILLGNGTGHKEYLISLKTIFNGDIKLVGEYGSTLEARKLYFLAHPPRGLWQFIPQSLVPISLAIDDFSAEVLWNRYRESFPPPLNKI